MKLDIRSTVYKTDDTTLRLIITILLILSPLGFIIFENGMRTSTTLEQYLVSVIMMLSSVLIFGILLIFCLNSFSTEEQKNQTSLYEVIIKHKYMKKLPKVVQSLLSIFLSVILAFVILVPTTQGFIRLLEILLEALNNSLQITAQNAVIALLVVMLFEKLIDFISLRVAMELKHEATVFMEDKDNST